MRVRMVQYISGLRAGQRWPAPGETLDCDDREGAKLCANGYAVPVAVKPEDRAERRVVQPDEDRHVCDVCGFESKTAAGLGAHSRKHK